MLTGDSEGVRVPDSGIVICQQEYKYSFRAWLWSQNNPTWKHTKPTVELIEKGLTRKQLRMKVDEINELAKELYDDHTAFPVCLRILSILLIICIIILMIAPNHSLHEFAAVTLAAVVILNVIQIGCVQPIEKATHRVLEAVSDHVENYLNDEYRHKKIEWEMVLRIKKRPCYRAKQYRHITVIPVDSHLLNVDIDTEHCDDDSVPSLPSQFRAYNGPMLCVEEKTKDTMETHESGSKSKATMPAEDDNITDVSLTVD